MLHPYFDNFETEQWLFCYVQHTTPVTFTFNVAPPSEWGEIALSRLRTHFEVFQLDSLFKAHAAEEMENIKTRLKDLYDVGGSELVRLHLAEEAAFSRSDSEKQLANRLLSSVSTNPWFCSGGYLKSQDTHDHIYKKL